jgi:hypothetical protein
MHPAASFRRDGYLLVRELFGPDEVRLLRDACDSALDRAPPLPRPGRARSPARSARCPAPRYKISIMGVR